MANVNINQLPAFVGTLPDTTLFVVQVDSTTFRATGEQLAAAFGGPGGGSGGISAIQPGSGIAVDNSNPAEPIVSALLSAGANITLTPQEDGSIRITSSGGGGGGGGGSYYFNVSPGTSQDVADLVANPDSFLLMTDTTMDLTGGSDDFDQAGTRVTIRAQVGACTVQSRGGTGLIFNGGSPGASFVIPAGGTAELMYYAVGYWFVVNQYSGAAVVPPNYYTIDADSLPTPFSVRMSDLAAHPRLFLTYVSGSTNLSLASEVNQNAGAEVVVKNLLGSPINVTTPAGNDIYTTSTTPTNSVSVAAGTSKTFVYAGYTWYQKE